MTKPTAYQFLFGTKVEEVAQMIVTTAFVQGATRETFNQAWYRLSGMSWFLSTVTNDPTYQIYLGAEQHRMARMRDDETFRNEVLSAMKQEQENQDVQA